MYYAAMRPYDVANGTGIRSTLFVSGCTHHCKGCFNGAYQDFKYGKPWDEQAEKVFLEYVQEENVKGVTILGGEPMEQTQDDDLLYLLQKIKDTHKNIWIYSGYTFEEICLDPKKYALLELCNVLVDGKFEQDKRNLMLRFRGSENQRIIDIQASLESGEVVLVSFD